MSCDCSCPPLNPLNYFVTSHTIFHQRSIPCSVSSSSQLPVSIYFFLSFCSITQFSSRRFSSFNTASATCTEYQFPLIYSSLSPSPFPFYVFPHPFSLFPPLPAFLPFSFSRYLVQNVSLRHGSEPHPSGVICSDIQHWRMKKMSNSLNLNWEGFLEWMKRSDMQPARRVVKELSGKFGKHSFSIPNTQFQTIDDLFLMKLRTEQVR